MFAAMFRLKSLQEFLCSWNDFVLKMAANISERYHYSHEYKKNKIFVVPLFSTEQNFFSFRCRTAHTGLFKMVVWVLTTCHTQYTWDRSICIFLFNRKTLKVFVTYLTGALYVHSLWFYRVIQNGCVGFNNLSYTVHLR